MNDKVYFEKEKVSVMRQIETEIFHDVNFYYHKEFVKDSMTAQLTGFVYSNLADERKLEYLFKRPTFWDWLLRRRRKATFDLKVKDLLLNAPKTPQSLRTYTVEPIFTEN